MINLCTHMYANQVQGKSRDLQLLFHSEPLKQSIATAHVGHATYTYGYVPLGVNALACLPLTTNCS